MFRKIIFWSHLVLGILGGVCIAIMSFTGAALAFEKELIAWAERDARQIDAPAAATARLSVEELLARVRTARPEAKINGVTLSNDPHAAVAVALPSNVALYVNPFTAELREGQSPRMRAFMQINRAWHTRLNFKPTPGHPTLGATLNAAANTGFVLLCMSGLVLWWPRAWNARVLRPSLWFVRGVSGKARDWNWHNVIGFWTLPAVFIMAFTGVVLSYRWANELISKIAGEPPPGAAARPATPSSAAKPATPAARPAALAIDALIARTQAEFPQWETITVRFAPPLTGANGPAPTSSSAVVRSSNQWPPFSTTTATVNAEATALRKTDAYGSLPPAQRARRWFRLLHTGEAFRWPGELIAGLGCLGACVLVWTGLALAWRRFFGRAAAEKPATV